MSATNAAPAPAPLPKRKKHQRPQHVVDVFWAKFTTKAHGKVTMVLPSNAYAERAARPSSKAVGKLTQASYEEVAAVCKANVAKIVKECRRVNQKYRDPYFDLELDMRSGCRDTLQSLSNVKTAEGEEQQGSSDFDPKGVKRVSDIFDTPRFYVDGPAANDVRQGRTGDCWLLAALCTLSNKPSLIDRVCVARDEQVGVYGFVFYRDGEWISVIIDDKLFLTTPDFDDSIWERLIWQENERVDSEEQYRKAYQSGSGALYFAQCENANETWLPLLEKAYAKAHGDYQAIESGLTGEGIEDLTGGVTTELYATDILDKEYFWREELMKVNDEFLFGCWTGTWGTTWGNRKGIVELHAYSVMRAVEIDGQRLVLLKNPWGRVEWTGPWSDGSKEWTAEWLTKLNHRFGDDGNFWISYKDLLRKYQSFNRTRLFGADWKVTSVWATVSVPWKSDYHDTYFAFSLAKTGPVVLVLAQLDDRYYRGLEGQYEFELSFRVHKKGEEDYVVRSIAPFRQTRSVNVELELEAGEYIVLMKIYATRDLDKLPIETVMRNCVRDRRDKLVTVGMSQMPLWCNSKWLTSRSYDHAHSKGNPIEKKDEKQEKKDGKENEKDNEPKKEATETSPSTESASKSSGEQNKPEAPSTESDKAGPNTPTGTDSSSPPAQSTTADGGPSPKSGDTDTQGDPSSKAEGDAPTATGAQSTKATEEGKGKDDSSAEAKGDAPATTGAPSTEAIKEEKGKDSSSTEATKEEKSKDDSPSEDKKDDSTTTKDAAEKEKEKDKTDATPEPPKVEEEEGEEDEFEKDPWNAVATVSLRVYYKVDADDREAELVALRVVRPGDQAEGGEGKPEEAEAKPSGLDVDDGVNE
ncbi:hypothetical protein F4861DRAFT_531595 [Xylaria intraflava]|nr:hypothetical protein F4861DRAFT_531595 [Xylaria intraflava]